MRIYIFLFISFCFVTQSKAQSNSSKPNIIFILADDLGYGDLGIYGQTKFETLHIDEMARKGLRFTQFYTGTSVCAPSRASLMSGQHTGHIYIRGNKEISPEGQEPLADTVITIASLLKENGYVTGAFGKWGLGMVGTSGDPNKKGFDEFYGYNCQRQAHSYYPNHLWHNNTKVEFENNLINRAYYAADLIHEKTLDFIVDNKNRPFFLFVPTVLPHAELSGPKDSLYQRYEHKFEETPYIGNHYASADKPRAMYASMVARMDEHVGQILQKLDELGIAENTIIMFASDNGAHKEGGADPDFFNSSGDLKGIKRSLYEGGIRTAFIAYWPNKIKENQVTQQKGAFWDIMPTLLDLSNTQPSQKYYTDGISLVPTLLGQGKQQQHDYLYWEFHEEGGRQALRKGDWKLIVQQAKNPEKRYYEFFNVVKDPSEKNNLFKKESKRAKRFVEDIKSVRKESELFPLLIK